MARLTLVSYLLFLFTALLCARVEAGYGHGPRYVREGQSIQRAINKARPGETIIVGKGHYREQLTISKDGIRLIGHNAVLEPPHKPPKKPNDCVGLAGGDTAAGICIIGHDVELLKFEKEHRKVHSVGRYVRDVKVEGFEVKGFSGLNIAVVGAKNTEIRHNTLVDGDAYGALTVGSISTHISDNRVKAAKLLFIGICMDDKSDVHVTDNYISDYSIALCVQTNGARVSGNKVRNSCGGVFVDPGVDGARITDNNIGTSPKECDAAGGIAVAGATNTKVSGNKVFEISDFGKPALVSSGIAIFDFDGRTASNNVVSHNVLKKNDQDLFLGSAGTNNKFVNNKCKTPGDLCKQ
ncbi:hypothetical protein ACHAQA_000721 [Verticillium albo-atrum]